MVTLVKELRDYIHPVRFGAKADAELLSNVVTTNAGAATTITNTVDAPFKPSHVGKAIYLESAGVSGALLTTTISSYISATQVQITTGASTPATMRALIGTDDTVAVQAAIAYALARSKGVMLDGAYIIQPTLLKSKTGLLGLSRSGATLYLKPGSATVNKYLLRNNATTDHSISIEGLTLNALRSFQKSGPSTILTDINALEHLGSTADTALGEVYNLYRDLLIMEAGRAAFKYKGRGLSRMAGIRTLKSGYGVDLTDSVSCHLSDVAVSALGAGFVLGANSSDHHLDSCVALKCGYTPLSNGYVDGENACWVLDGATNNHFTNCGGRESWGSIWHLNAAHRNEFIAARASDAGCVYADGLGANNGSATRAAFRLISSNDNRFNASVGHDKHPSNNYGTHAALLSGSSDNNTGDIAVDATTAAWITAMIDRSTTGVNNTLRVGGEMVSHRDSDQFRRFFNGDFA